MKSLEKKFYKYLNGECVSEDFKSEELRKNIAHELAEIAEKEKQELKKQISEIRYLNSKEVKNIVEDGIYAYQYGYDEINEIAFEEARENEDSIKEIECDTKFNKDIRKNRESSIKIITDRICSLALPPKEKIIKIFKEWKVILDKLANEILGDDGE